MYIKSLKLKNFKLFKNQEIIFDKINIITGDNYSGKSTILKGIIFGYYGEALGTTLQRLISFGEKETEVDLIDDNFQIIRKVPNSLQVFENGKEIDLNTPTLKQNYINEKIKDYEFFKKYRLMNKYSINLLDYAKDSRSIVTLRKELMNFIDTDSEKIRKKLLDQKLERERFSTDKKLYHFYLSQKRLNTLETGLEQIKIELNTVQTDIESQQQIVNKLTTDITSAESKIILLDNQITDNLKNIEDSSKSIKEYNNKLIDLKNKPIIEPIKVIDYDTQLIEAEKTFNQSRKKLKAIESNIESLNKEIEDLNFKKYSINTKIEENNLNQQKITKEISGLDNVKIGTKCDKCGSIVSVEYKNSYRNEKVQIMTKLTEEISKLKKSLETIIKDSSAKEIELKTIMNKKEKAEENNTELHKEIQTINDNRTNQIEKIKSQETELSERKVIEDKYQDLIKTYEEQIKKYNQQNETNKKTIEDVKNNIVSLASKLKDEESCIKYYNSLYEDLQSKESKTKENIIKLKEAFKFSEYKYTEKDVKLYDASIKTWDEFTGWYIQQWLDSLTFIINDLLKEIGLSVSFSADKQFLTIIENGRELDYNDLSGGQSVFLSVVFKLSILLQNAINDGCLILDEGLNELKYINLLKLLNIFKRFNFQIFLIYQNILNDIPEVNYINVIREGNESYVKK